MLTIRTILALASIHHCPSYQMDVENAFRQGDLQEVYMTIPQGFNNDRDYKVCQL